MRGSVGLYAENKLAIFAFPLSNWFLRVICTIGGKDEKET